MERWSIALQCGVAAVLTSAYWDAGCTQPTLVMLLSALAVFHILPRLLNPTPVLATTATTSPSAPVQARPDATYSSKFHISIIDIRLHRDKVEYLIKGQYNSFVWTSWKRYSALRKLKLAIPSFPPKSWAAESDLGFVQRRRELLNIMFARHMTKDLFENGISDLVREQALGVPVDSIPIDKASANKQELLASSLVALDMASRCVHLAAEGGGEGWVQFGASRNVVGFIREHDSQINLVCRGTVDKFTKDQVFAFVLNNKRRYEWDEGFKFEELLESCDLGTEPQPVEEAAAAAYDIAKLAVFRTGTLSPAKRFVAERDSVCLAVQAKRKADGALFTCHRSVQHSKAPEGAEEYVRAIVHCAGFVVQDRTDGEPGCVLTSVAMLDPVGNIPKWVINLALKSNKWQPWTLLGQLPITSI
ncbi:hypothetical protein BASA81_001797 [Batrachochytrium salamandrivorans]|nr:hypothetical protein BASA81_001797 [Batrachochytrium salamandrivorans]